MSPFFPPRLVGREAIGKHYGAVWRASPIRILEIRQVAVHIAGGSNVTVSEAKFTAETPAKARFDLAFAIVMHVENGEIMLLRDYMDALGAAYHLGRMDMLVKALEQRR